MLVAGGRPTGCVVALAEAFNERKVLLIERYGFLWGMLTEGMVVSSDIYIYSISIEDLKSNVDDEDVIRNLWKIPLRNYK